MLSAVKLYFKQNLFDNEELVAFLLNYYGYSKSYDEFESIKEISEFIIKNNITALDGVYKRTYEDMRIGNFLYLNNIKYEYRTHYPFRKKEFSSIMSYFYLKDYDKYIVNLCIDKDGSPLKFIKKNLRGERLKLYYNSYIKFWERDKFKDKVIFTYYYENEDGKFLDILKEKLIENKINIDEENGIRKKSSKDNTIERKKLLKKCYLQYTFVVKLVANFITLMKTTATSPSDLYKIDSYSSIEERERALSFYKVVIPVYEYYQNILKEEGKIDFNDMILTGKEYVKRGLFKKNYKYILIDEFQDISNSRMELVEAIANVNDSHIFAVGDDYQSIFRFTGSDINIFYKFEKKYSAKKYLIEKNYRFDSYIADVTNKFILKNPYQVEKHLVSDRVGMNSIKFVYCRNDFADNLLARLMELEKNASVFLLGRYNNDIKDYIVSGKMNIVIDKDGKTHVNIFEREDLDIKFMSVHKSKGLEADYVFLLNTFDKLLGFPCNISDDCLIRLLLKGEEDFPYSEERRLFYVALTRAKKEVFLMVDMLRISPFLRELDGFVDLVKYGMYMVGMWVKFEK